LIAEELGVSRNIVVMAFEQLGMEGYLQGKSGSGSFVADFELLATSDKLQAASCERRAVSDVLQEERRLTGDFLRTLERVVLPRNTMREEILPFQTGQPAFDAFPFAVWSKLAARVYRYLDFQHLGYEDAAGYFPLREAIADHLRVNRSVQCEADRILIVNGTQQALTLCAQLLLQPGDRFWIDDPGYVNARAVFTLFGGEPCPIPVTGEGIDIDYAFRHHPDGKLAYLTPSHQDPVGGTLPLAQRLRLLAWANEHRCWLIEDDYDSELRYRGKPIPSLQGLDTHGNVIYTGTFSKVLFPALRIAYMVLPDREVFQAFKSLKALNDRQSPLTDQLILTDFIKEGYFHRHLRKMRGIYNERLQCLLGELQAQLSDRLSFTDPSAGMHLAAYFSAPVDEVRLMQAAAARKLVLPSLREYTLGNYDRPGILLGYAAFPEEKIRKAVRALADCFAEIS
jgi:GntR family transcriptional regulator/MocR family aminotransferase